MTDAELLEFLRATLLKIEVAEKLMAHTPPRHIPAYRKIGGVEQKLKELPEKLAGTFFLESVQIRGVLTYFLNGRYEDGMKQLSQAKLSFIHRARTLDANNSE